MRGNHLAIGSSRLSRPSSQSFSTNEAVNVFVMLYARNASSSADSGTQNVCGAAPARSMTLTLATPRPLAAAMSTSGNLVLKSATARFLVRPTVVDHFHCRTGVGTDAV